MCQADSVFSGISTFGRLPYFPCLASDDEKFDIAFLGQRNHPYATRPWTLISDLQVLHLTLALPTVQVLGLAQVASAKVLAVLIFSTLISVLEAYFLVVDTKAHGRCASVEGTTCKSELKISSTDITN